MIAPIQRKARPEALERASRGGTISAPGAEKSSMANQKAF
jgi:hypothetical protein